MRYPALIVRDGEDGSYSITFPDMPGCTSAAFCLDEAVDNAFEAASLWLEDATACHEPWPEPSRSITVRDGETVTWVEIPAMDLKAA